MPAYSIVMVPPGDLIHATSPGKLDVPDRPIIPFIEGDGTGPDIWRASPAVFDAAVNKACRGERRGEEADRVSPERDGGQEYPLSPDERRRREAGLARGDGAARARGGRVRARARAAQPHVRPQGQHHEVHRGRLPRLGLRP